MDYIGDHKIDFPNQDTSEMKGALLIIMPGPSRANQDKGSLQV